MSKRSKEMEFDARIDLFRQRTKDSDDFKVQGEVFDTPTLMSLYSLASKGLIDFLGGPISTGKEAHVFYAFGGGKDLALKIYKVSTSNFRAMQDYLQGDPRFSSIKGDKRSIVSAWTRKEFRNLKRSEEVGVLVPHPITMRGNILVMELIGSKERPAPPLKDVILDLNEASRVWIIITDYIARLFNQAKLIHADLSEFNVLYERDPVIIDMGQAVTLDHPMALKFLERDIKNIVRYFQKRYRIGSLDEIWSKLELKKSGHQVVRRDSIGD
ncbi:MAG: serine protein kinase RIO [Methanotrichaceae archaeon]|nr:serine protein kinase RIO [Methanotrichaceae archaeon]